jgi:hypothetical protein
MINSKGLGVGMHTKDEAPVLDRKNASKYLGISISMLDSKLDIPFLKIGRSKRYLKSDLDTFLLSVRKGGVK